MYKDIKNGKSVGMGALGALNASRRTAMKANKDDILRRQKKDDGDDDDDDYPGGDQAQGGFDQYENTPTTEPSEDEEDSDDDTPVMKYEQRRKMKKEQREKFEKDVYAAAAMSERDNKFYNMEIEKEEAKLRRQREESEAILNQIKLGKSEEKSQKLLQLREENRIAEEERRELLNQYLQVHLA